jgi:hypothetical protein
VNRHFVDVLGVLERASATPTTAREKRRPAHGGRTRHERPATHPAGLRQGQQWFADAITMPESEPAAVSDEEAEQMLTPGPRLSAIERLEIYRRGYHARLVECLADDYPVLKHALGDVAFEDLCRAYIAGHPSRGPNLNVFGRRMARFCLGEAPSPFPRRSFAADLAALEWAIVEVIHAPSSEALTLEGLGDVPAQAWEGARLVANPASRVLRFEHPVNAYFQAVRDGRTPSVPAGELSATVVYRSGATVWRMDLTAPMFDVLSSLVAGETLVASLSRAEGSAGEVDEQVMAQRVTGWFREWVGSGLFARVELG